MSERDLLGMLSCATPEHGDHAAVTGLMPGVVHQAAAQRDQLEPGALLESARSHERRELTERMAGHHLAGRAAERVPAGQAGAEDRRLREVGALAGARERVVAHGLHGEFEQLWPGAPDIIAHRIGLTSLPWEQDCCRMAHPDSTYATFAGEIQASRAFPPFGGRR